MVKKTDETEDGALLSQAELDAIEASVKADIEAERRDAAKKVAREKIERELRYKDGLVTGIGAKDEMVTMTLDLAPHASDIKINGRSYFHGATYTVPRHVADTLREVSFRTWKHEYEKDGKSLMEFLGANRVSSLYDVKKGKSIGHKISATTGDVTRLG